ncbi:MAG: IS1380 family transposase [bacterium]
MPFIEKHDQPETKQQIDRRPRKERRLELLNLRRRKKKLERKLKPFLLETEFTNANVTTFGNFHLLQTFKQAIDFKGLICKNLSLEKAANSLYPSEDVVDFLVDANCLGYSRFEHTECLRIDPGYREVKGIDRFPSEKVFRDFFGACTADHLKELCEINRQLLQLRARWEGPKEVSFDIDSIVVTAFGEQEEATKRYNPRYKGRLSFELMACFISGTKDLLHIDFCRGNHTPRYEFKAFFQTCESLLPENYVLRGVRLDKGFFSESNIAFIEKKHLEYAAKVPLYSNLRSWLERLPESDWTTLSEGMSVSRKKLLLDSWAHERYIDIRRLKVEKKTGQMVLPDAVFYRYEAVLSSRLEKRPEENLAWYDDRASCENYIKELQDGFAANELSQHEKTRNHAYALVKAIAYNLTNFFKAVALPKGQASWQAETIRRKLFCVPGNILGRTRNRRVKLAPNRFLDWLMPLIRNRMDEFLWFVANGFQQVKPALRL